MGAIAPMAPMLPTHGSYVFHLMIRGETLSTGESGVETATSKWGGADPGHLPLMIEGMGNAMGLCYSYHTQIFCTQISYNCTFL